MWDNLYVQRTSRSVPFLLPWLAADVYRSRHWRLHRPLTLTASYRTEDKCGMMTVTNDFHYFTNPLPALFPSIFKNNGSQSRVEFERESSSQQTNPMNTTAVRCRGRNARDAASCDFKLNQPLVGPRWYRLQLSL